MILTYFGIILIIFHLGFVEFLGFIIYGVIAFHQIWEIFAHFLDTFFSFPISSPVGSPITKITMDSVLSSRNILCLLNFFQSFFSSAYALLWLLPLAVSLCSWGFPSAMLTVLLVHPVYFPLQMCMCYSYPGVPFRSFLYPAFLSSPCS